MTFAEASAVHPDGEGTWAAEIAPGWDIAGNANGGYLLAIAARALAAATGRPDPATVTAHYLAPGSPGPVTVDATVLRAGRRFATASATLRRDDGTPLLAVLGSFTDLATGTAEGTPERVHAGPPALPPIRSCILVEATDTFPPPFMGKVELRLHPEDAGFTGAGSSGRALVRGWFRLPEDEPVDTLGLLLAVDAFPPTIFNARLPVAGAEPPGEATGRAQAPAAKPQSVPSANVTRPRNLWTPTLELTAHVRTRPASGWLRCSFRTRFVTGGFLEEDGEVWDEADRLVAQSRQLALLPRP